MSAIEQRLLEVAHDLGQSDPVPNTYFQELLGLSSGRISQLFEPGAIAKLGAKSIGRLTKLGYNPDWIQEGRPPKLLASKEGPQGVSALDLIAVPRVKFKLSAGVSGFSVEVESGNGRPIFFRKDWFELRGYKPGKLLAVRVTGESMEPSLWDDDIVVINTDDTIPKDGEAFALNYEGEPVIKRLRRDAGEWWACSDSADQRRYAPKQCTEDVVIIGRAVYKQSERI